jgi:hypothetical protein
LVQTIKCISLYTGCCIYTLFHDAVLAIPRVKIPLTTYMQHWARVLMSDKPEN